MHPPPRGSTLVEALVALVVAAAVALPVVAAATRTVAAVDAAVDRRHALHVAQSHANAALATGCDARGGAAPVRTDSADTPAGPLVRVRRTTADAERIEVRLITVHGTTTAAGSVPCD